MNETIWTDNVIIADAEFIDKVAFDLTVNFERMLERQIPQADITKWVEYVALDGGLRQGEHQTTVILIHDQQQVEMKNFQPGIFDKLNGQAFNGNLGEFCFNTPSTEAIVSKDDLFIDTVQTMLQQQEVKRLMLIPCNYIYNNVREVIRKADMQADFSNKHITLFAMQPMPGGHFNQEILGYSLMAALGIRGDELTCKQ